MKKNVTGRLLLIGLTLVAAFVCMLPNMPGIYAALPSSIKAIVPERGIVLGLDLQGGLHLVFEVDGQKAAELRAEDLARLLEAEAKKQGITEAGQPVTLKSEGIEVVVSPASTALDKIIRSDYTVLEGAGLGRYRLIAAEVTSIKRTAVDQALETIRNRIDQFGVAEPVIHRQGENEIVVQLPGVKDPKRAIDLIGQTALLEFKLVDDKSSLAAELPQAIKPSEEAELLAKFKDKLPEGDEILFERSVNKDTGEVFKLPMVLRKSALITGAALSEARVSIDTRYNEPYVSLRFNDSGAIQFEKVTADNVNQRMAIILDGNIYSAPVIRERIAGGNAQISGNFTMDTAKDLAIVLKAGALPAPVKMLQNLTVGPSLGRDSIEAGKRAGIVGAVLVIVFMIVYYRFAGLIADVALVFNIVLLLGAMAAFNATLTMPGIAGVILAIGMAVDSNVLMFERMREELRAGKTPKAAVDSGYHKAFWTIFDSHVTTLITSFVLFQFGTGPIKGFAVTLSLGVAINLFTALVGTKTIFDLIFRSREVNHLSI